MSIERRYVQTDLGVPMEFVTYSDHLAEIERVREEERARAFDIVDHFFMDREAEQRIKAAITNGAKCTCPSESCPIAFLD